MTDNVTAIHGPPRTASRKIRQLYENDAQSPSDTDLVDGVAFGFYARCRSILTTYSAEQGLVVCPRCGVGIPRMRRDEAELLCCPNGDWQVTWGAYWHSYRHEQLSAGRAVSGFVAFVERWCPSSSVRRRRTSSRVPER
jgi:hypothetical protein